MKSPGVTRRLKLGSSGVSMKFDQLQSLPRPRPSQVVAGLEAVLVLALGVQAARLAWSLLEPSAAAITSPARVAKPAGGDLSILSRFDPFFRIQPTAEPAAAPAGPTADQGLRLFGVRVAGDGQGSAIIRTSDGREASFAAGEEVEPGLVLKTVAADHVILARGASRTRLEFLDTAPPPVAATAAAPLGPSPAASVQNGAQGVDAKQLMAAASLLPRMKDGKAAGYQVLPRGGDGGRVLAAAGLQPGDVLLAIDGSEMNAERISELPAELAKSSEVELRIERGGQIMNTRVRIAPR